MEENVSSKEFEQFQKRYEEDRKRTNARLKDVEDNAEKTLELAGSVKSLADSIEKVVDIQKEQGEKIDKIENMDGEKYRTISMYIITTIIGLIIGYFFK